MTAEAAILRKDLVKNVNSQDYILEVNIDNVMLNPYQPRQDVSSDEICDLADSIRAVGIIQPPIVRSIPGSNNFELVAGERRFRAARMVGLKTISVIVNNMNNEISAQMALIENVQRVDLNPMEVAKALRNLIGEFEYSQEAIANKIGKKRSTISNYLRLLRLPPKVRNSLSVGEISMGHAKAILSLEGSKLQEKLHKKVLKDGLTVRQTESLASRWLKKPSELAFLAERDSYLSNLEESLQRLLGSKVKINGSDSSGKLSIDYTSRKELERIVSILG